MFLSRWLKTHQRLFLLSRLLLSKESQFIFLDYPLHRIPRSKSSLATFLKLSRIIRKNDDQYHQTLDQMCQFAQYLTSSETNPSKLINWKWDNGWFPPLDVMCLYSLVRSFKPRIVIEVGSGVSTSVICKAIEHQNINSKLICIDPEPRVVLSTLVSKHMRTPLEKIDLSIFKRLSKNDFLIIDGSHVGLMNSDVTIFFTEILPHLKPGVLVQIHDVYLPYDYPFSGTSYNEQYFLSTLLLMNAHLGKIIFPSYYVTKNKKFLKQKQLLSKSLAVPNSLIHGGSFWFQIK